MFLIALMGLMAAAAAAVWQVAQQRERERELLFIGKQFSDAIRRYRDADRPSAAPLLNNDRAARITAINPRISPNTPEVTSAGSPAPAQTEQNYPKTIEQLLLDRRVPYTRRFLRQLYFDPMTNSSQWGLIRNAQGGIVGVHSLSEKKPIRTSNFGNGPSFGEVNSYRDWVFGPGTE